MAFTGNYTCDVFRAAAFTGAFDFTNDVIKLALYTDAATLDADTTGYTVTGEVADAGYAAGGAVLTPAVVTGAVSFATFNDVSWSGAITARGALMYKADGLTNPAICVLDFGSDKTSLVNFTVKFPAATAATALLRIS